MKKVCIVQGGPFLLGIDCDHVIARRTWDETAAQAEKEAIFHLNALLSRQTVHTVPEEAVCLELRNGQESVFIAADRIAADEAEIINPPSPLPSACPALIAKLCPQVTIWEGRPLLLLEPTQLVPVAAESGENIGLLLFDSAEEIRDDQPALQEAAEPEPEEDDPFFPVMEAAEADDEPSAPQAAMPFFPQQAPAEADEQAQNKESAAIDEETFKQVMNWTIARFKQSRKGEELHLGMEQLPHELASMIKRKGLNKNVIEYLMEQIVFRCKESMSRKQHGGGNA